MHLGRDINGPSILLVTFYFINWVRYLGVCYIIAKHLDYHTSGTVINITHMLVSESGIEFEGQLS